MPDVLPPLGKTKDVLIRGMPESVWELVTAAARRNDVTIAVWLTRHLEKFGCDGVEFVAPPPPPAQAAAAASLEPVLFVAKALGEVGALEPATARALNLMVRRFVSPRRPRQLTQP